MRIDLFFAVLFLASTGLPIMGLADSPGPERVLLERDAEFDRVTAEQGLEGFLYFAADDAAFFPAGGHISVGADGAWKVAADIGIPSPAPDAEPSE